MIVYAKAKSVFHDALKPVLQDVEEEGASGLVVDLYNGNMSCYRIVQLPHMLLCWRLLEGNMYLKHFLRLDHSIAVTMSNLVQRWSVSPPLVGASVYCINDGNRITE